MIITSALNSVKLPSYQQHVTLMKLEPLKIAFIHFIQLLRPNNQRVREAILHIINEDIFV